MHKYVRRIAHHRYPGNQMKDEGKTRKQLLEELVVLRERVTELKKAESESKRAEQKLRETRDYAESIVETVREPLVVLDADLRVISANRSFYETFKVKPGETEGQLLYDLGDREWDIPKLRELLEVILPTDTTFDNFEVEHEFKTIGRRVMHLNARRIYRETNETHLILLAIEDVTERKRAEEEIHDLAYYDGVTRLPNRQLFREHLSRALAYAKRHKRLLAVLFLDLDHFKHINDTLGHHVGDLLLRCVADRLKKILRKSDLIARHEADDSISYVSRFGGDEFVLLLTDLKQPHDAANVAQRALYELSKAFLLEEREIFVSSSIGISLYPSDGNDVNTLIKNADTAMYHAKNQGRNNFQFYADYMHTTISRRLTLDSALRKALELAELTLYYQPQLDINSDRIIGTEALIRWRHPELGAVSPTEFIPLAEEAGLIESINEWVLRTACSQNLAWQAAGFAPMRMAVNFSSLSFKQRRIVKTISRVLRDIGMAPQLLEIELTEGSLVRNEKETIRALEQLKELGICVAIDDFGTGHFSLYHLRHYPLDAIKIDRCFIKDIGAAQDSTAVTTAIIAMARGLQLRVIAEGVETKQQLTFLRLQGCDEAQGYLFSRPVPSNDIVQLLSTEIT